MARPPHRTPHRISVLALALCAVALAGCGSAGSGMTNVPPPPAAPTLVQHVSSSNTRANNFTSPFCYHFQLPNPTTAGNAVVVGFSFNGNPTPSVTDDKNNPYVLEQNFFDSADNQSAGIAAAFNVAAGARAISLCFSADPGGFVQPVASEFANVIGFDAGSSNHGTGNSISAGSATPAAAGDLVYQVSAYLDGSLNQSSFTAGSQSNITWNLASADLMDGLAVQYGLYTSTATLTPTMAMGTSGRWVTSAVFLKAGAAGSFPSGMRIVHLQHENIPFNVSAGGTGNPFANPLKLQFPSSGNLLVAMIGGGSASETVRSISDSGANTWAQAGSTQVIANNDTVQAFYAGNATTSSSLALTLNWSGTSGDFTIFLYDVAGAAASPLDSAAVVGATGTQSIPDGSGTFTAPFTLTPSSANELVFTEVIWDFNTGTGLAGQFFDTNTFSGESISGPEPVDQNNGWGHVLASNTQPISFTWSLQSNNLAVGNWASLAVAFK